MALKWSSDSDTNFSANPFQCNNFEPVDFRIEILDFTPTPNVRSSPSSAERIGDSAECEVGIND